MRQAKEAEGRGENSNPHPSTALPTARPKLSPQGDVRVEAAPAKSTPAALHCAPPHRALPVRFATWRNRPAALPYPEALHEVRHHHAAATALNEPSNRETGAATAHHLTMELPPSTHLRHPQSRACAQLPSGAVALVQTCRITPGGGTATPYPEH